MIETTSPPHGPDTADTVGRFGRRLAYLLSGFPIGAAAFTVAVAGCAIGAVGSLVLLGLPVLMATLAGARWVAAVERRRVEAVTGRVLPPHGYRPPTGTGIKGWLRRCARRSPGAI